MSGSRPPVISGSELDVRYRGEAALDALTFTIEAGTSTALVGANGSGKSTLLNTLAGLTRPSSGELTVETDNIAYVLQHRGRGNWMPLSVKEVLRMGRYRGRRPWERLQAVDRREAATAAERLGVDHLLRHQFSELSGGEQQRVLVAQALAQGAALLLMDEPITGLDMPSQERILAVIEEEARAGVTVVLSTHHLDEAHHCDQVLLLATRLVAAGPPEEVLRPEMLRIAYEAQMFGAHAGHDHPPGILLLDEHGHDHDV